MKPVIIGDATLYLGDCIESMKKLESGSVQMCVTSPPYFGLRDYGHDGQIGLEDTPEQYIAKLVEVFRAVREVLADDGTLWVNIGDSYIASSTGNVGKSMTITGGKANQDSAAKRPDKKAGNGLKTKDLIGIPWMLAFALRADGWYLRQDIIWHKPNPMPESVTDRCTKAHEYMFLLSKSAKYFYDHEAVKEPAVSEKPAGNKNHKYADAYAAGGSEEHRTKAGLVALACVEWQTRNRRSVWSIATRPYKGAHFAVFPPALVEPCILAGSRPGDVVIDPFNGSGTTGQVSLQHGRKYIGIDLNQAYIGLTVDRLSPDQGQLFAPPPVKQEQANMFEVQP